jgi:uncharacterized protein with GYD domain
MTTFFMFGKYSAESIKGMSAERTKEVTQEIEKLGGKVNDIYGLMGEHDLVLIVDFLGLDEAVKTSIRLNRMTGISFSTSPAIPVDTLDDLIT